MSSQRGRSHHTDHISASRHAPDSSVDYTVEIIGTNDDGAEIVVSLVNVGEQRLLQRVS